MTPKVSNSAALRQDEPGSHADDRDSYAVRRRGDGLSLRLHLLRQAIDASGWKHAAVAAIIGVNEKYFSRMLDGEKAWTLRHQELLPDEIEREFARLYAEHLGLIAVAIPTSVEQARRDLVSGLFGLLHRLPEKASAMARAELPTTTARKVTA